MRILAGLFFSASLCLFITGCGPSGPAIATVEGTVKMDGKPLADASVVFIPENGRPAGAWTDANGHYVLNFGSGRKGALPGKHRVRISTYREGGGEDADGKPMKSAPETVPSKYNQQTELTFTVEDGKNNVADFEVSSDGKIVKQNSES